MTAPSRRVVLEDPSLPHQIVLTVSTSNNGKIAVSCNCLKKDGAHTNRAGAVYKPIETRRRWDATEAIAVWRAHLEAVSAA